MGTSLAWRTDTQLHDAVRLQLEEDPAIRAHELALVASEGVITLTGFVDSVPRQLPPQLWPCYSSEGGRMRVGEVMTKGVQATVDVVVQRARASAT